MKRAVLIETASGCAVVTGGKAFVRLAGTEMEPTVESAAELRQMFAAIRDELAAKEPTAPMDKSLNNALRAYYQGQQNVGFIQHALAGLMGQGGSPWPRVHP